MSRPLWVLLVLVAFAGGVGCAWFWGLGATVMAPAPNSSNGLGASPSDQRLEQILQRLAAIETRLGDRHESTLLNGSDAPVRTEESDLKDYLATRLDELQSEIRRTTAGLGELTRLKPQPDGDALASFRLARQARKADAPDPTRGWTFRDAVLEFGAPTFTVDQNDRVHGPSGGRVTTWLWELPDLGIELMMQFEGGTCFGSTFGTPGRLREYATTLGKH